MFGEVSRGGTLLGLAWMIFSPLALAAAVGKAFAKPDPWSLEMGIPILASTRPMSCGDLLLAKFKAAAISALITWSIVLIVTPIWLVRWCDTSALAKSWHNAREWWTPSGACLIVLVLLVAMIVLTWKLLISSVWLAMSGRPIVYLTSIILEICGYFILGICLVSDSVQRDLVPIGKWLANYVPIIVLIVLGLAIMKISMAITQWRRNRELRLVDDSQARGYWIVWIFATACVAEALMIALAPDPLTFLAAPALPLLAIILAFFIMPVWRISMAPEMLARNRHR